MTLHPKNERILQQIVQTFSQKFVFLAKTHTKEIDKCHKSMNEIFKRLQTRVEKKKRQNKGENRKI